MTTPTPKLGAAMTDEQLDKPTIALAWARARELSCDEWARIYGARLSARQPAAIDKEAVGQWVHCSPSLLNAGVSCANTPRRACECNPENGGHDHFIAHSAAPLDKEASKPAAQSDDLLPNALWTRNGSGSLEWWTFKGYEARKDAADQWVLRRAGAELYRHTHLQVVMAHAEREILAVSPAAPSVEQDQRGAFEAWARRVGSCNADRTDMEPEKGHFVAGWDAALRAARAASTSANVAQGAETVGEVVANDPVHGWHFQPYIGWQEIGAAKHHDMEPLYSRAPTEAKDES